MEFVKLWVELGLVRVGLRPATAHRSSSIAPWSIPREGQLPGGGPVLTGWATSIGAATAAAAGWAA